MTQINIPFDPRNFTGGPITNQFMPLAVGNTWFYEVTDGSTDTVTVTSQTITIDGVQCVVVTDIVEEDGKIVESTKDYFAQDKAGNVWYFGEDTKEFLPGGGVSTEGTWRAGVNNAVPGIIMLANPMEGNSYFEENAPNVAVDQAKVLTAKATAAVPFGKFKGTALETRNSSALFPGDIEFKFYAPGIGSVLEIDADGNRQRLVSFNGQTSSEALVQAMAGFGGSRSGLEQGHATLASDNATLHDMLTANSHRD